MLGVGNSITDDILQEDLEKRKKKIQNRYITYLEDAPGLLVDESTDSFDTAPPCKTPDSRLGDALHIIHQQTIQ